MDGQHYHLDQSPYLCYCYLIGKEGNRSEYLKQKNFQKEGSKGAVVLYD